MADFSIGDALGSGFGLMGRRPVSVLAWGLTYLIVGMALPAWLFLGALGPDFFQHFQSLRPGVLPPADFAAAMMPVQARMMVFQPIMFVTTLAAQAILTAAVFRATLEPSNRGLLYLRLGGRELWLALLNFVLRILAAILLVVMALVGLALGFALNTVFESQHVAWVTRDCTFAGLGLVVFALFVGICVRFSLAAPMTFADNTFRLFESWTLTRRHGWKLFGLGFLVALVSIVVVIAFEAVVFGGAFLAAGGYIRDPAGFWALLQDPHRVWSSGVGEWLIALTLIGAYAFGGLFAIALAPWAVAYRELQSRPKPPPLGGLFAEEPAPAPALEPVPPPPAVMDHGAHDDHGGGEAQASTDDHGHDDHGHADPHAPAEADGHGDHGDSDHGPADDHGRDDAHDHGDAHGHGDDRGHH